MEKDDEIILSENTTDTEKNKDEKENKDKVDESTENKEEIKEKQISEKKEEEQESNNIKENAISLKKLLFIAIIIILLLLTSTVFAILNINNSNIINGVYIENFNISKLSKEDATNIVKERVNNIEDIELSYGTYNTIVKLEELGVEISSKQAINNAINLGKTNNIVKDNYSILFANIFKRKFNLDIKIDEEKFIEAIKNIQAEIPEAIKEYSYDIKEDKLIITNGKFSKKIIKEELKKLILKNIKEQFNGNKTILSIPTQFEEPEKINIEKIYAEIYKEAKDAYIVEEPFQLHKPENGIDFAITMQEAKKVLEENRETYIIPLKITEPQIGVEDLGDKLFKQNLSKYTTIYDAGVKIELII